MEKLLELAQKAADQVEIFSIQSTANKVSFKDAKLYNIDTDFQSGVSLRIIKNGRLGFAYTRNLTDRQGLLNNAVLSLEGGVEAGFDFPGTAELQNIDTYDPSVKTMTNNEALAETKRICEALSAKTAGEIMDLLTNIHRMYEPAILFVTHNRALMKRYPGRVLICENMNCREVEISQEIDFTQLLDLW